MKLIGYSRVSTEGQKDDGCSLAVQRTKVTQYADLYGHEIVAFIEDGGASGKTLQRPGLIEALRRLDAGDAEGLVVAKLDRLTRSVRDLAELIDPCRGVFSRSQLVSVGEQVDTSTAGGRLVLNLLASVNQWERETIGERTAAAMQHKRQSFEYTGGRVRYGYQIAADGARLEPCSLEQDVIARICALRRESWSLRDIVDEMRNRGCLGRTGQPLGLTQVARILNELAAELLKVGAES